MRGCESSEADDVADVGPPVGPAGAIERDVGSAACVAATICRRRSFGCWPCCHHRAVDGRVSPSRLADWIVQTSGGLTATLRRLEEAGYIVRSDDPADGAVGLFRSPDWRPGVLFHRVR